jgi:hypothetical protein
MRNFNDFFTEMEFLFSHDLTNFLISEFPCLTLDELKIIVVFEILKSTYNKEILKLERNIEKYF